MEPYAFNPHTFGRMLPWVDSKQSVTLFQEMRTAGLLDEQGYPVPPPYANQTEWYSAQRLPLLFFSRSTASSWKIHCYASPCGRAPVMLNTFTHAALVGGCTYRHRAIQQCFFTPTAGHNSCSLTSCRDELQDALKKILISHFARDSDWPSGAIKKHMAALWKMFYAALAGVQRARTACAPASVVLHLLASSR